MNKIDTYFPSVFSTEDFRSTFFPNLALSLAEIVLGYLSDMKTSVKELANRASLVRDKMGWASAEEFWLRSDKEDQDTIDRKLRLSYRRIGENLGITKYNDIVPDAYWQPIRDSLIIFLLDFSIFELKNVYRKMENQKTPSFIKCSVIEEIFSLRHDDYKDLMARIDVILKLKISKCCAYRATSRRRERCQATSRRKERYCFINQEEKHTILTKISELINQKVEVVRKFEQQPIFHLIVHIT